MKTLSKERKREFSRATTTSVCFLRHSHKSMWGKAVQASRYMCMLLNWIKKFQLPLNGPNLPSSSPFGLHGTSGRTGVFVLVRFACPCNKKLLENAMQKCNQPNESNIIHGWWLGGIKHMAATIKARNSRDGCCSPFTRWCFASYDPRIFVNLKSSKQVKWAVYRQESKAEQSRRKSFVWDLFLHNLSFDTPVSHILFLP